MNTQIYLSPANIRKSSEANNQFFPAQKKSLVKAIERRSGSVNYNVDKAIKPPSLNILEDQTAASSKGFLYSNKRRLANNTALRPGECSSPIKLTKNKNNRRLDPLDHKRSDWTPHQKDNMYATM